MRAPSVGQTLPIVKGIVTFMFFMLGTLGMAFTAQAAAPADIQAVLDKANQYIEATKATERAVDSWDRYRSWVNMKTGPTGKERYISYGMYELHDIADQLTAVRAAARQPPGLPKLDAAMTSYLDAYDALAPVMSRAVQYYDSKGYESDSAAEGQELHKQMVPLATTFLAQRDAMMPELRSFVRDAERQELAALEAREGRSSPAWQAGQVMHAANRVIDLFPHTRPEPVDSDTLDAQIAALGPDTPGEKFDEIMSGVKPSNAVIDVKKFGEALKGYADAVAVFDRFSPGKSREFDELKPLPRQLLDMLRAFQEPLKRSSGREFDGAGQMVGQITGVYFEMLNAGSPIAQSQLRYLP